MQVAVVSDEVVDVAVGAASGTWVALHGADASVETFGGEGSGGGGAGSHAGGVVLDVVVEERIVGVRKRHAERTVVVVALTHLAISSAVGTGGLVGGVACAYVLLELTYGTVAFACGGVGPLVVAVGAGVALKVGGSKAGHAPEIAQFTEVGVVAVVDVA